MSLKSSNLQQNRTLEVLSSLSYRTGELDCYLREITLGVSELLNLDWSVVTLCENNFDIVEMLSGLREMPEAIERKIEFEPALTAAHILGDKDKLKQILINLVRNGCEAIACGDAVNLQVLNPIDTNQICVCIHNGGEPPSLRYFTEINSAFLLN